MEFVEKQILPRYNAFGQGHGLRHVQQVVRQSVELARIIGADIDMAYTVAAYHDLGMSGPRAIHHLTGGRILMADARLRRWFSAEQLKIMKEAVEDHRASMSRQPRSIYGKIVAEANRNLDARAVFTHTIRQVRAAMPDKSKDEQWQRFAKHMEQKYSTSGYIKLWIPNSPNEAKLQQLRNIIEDTAQLRQYFEALYEE